MGGIGTSWAVYRPTECGHRWCSTFHPDASERLPCSPPASLSSAPVRSAGI